MPLLDVSEVLDDPDFADTFTVEQKTEVPAGHGRATFSTTTISGVTGVVVPASGQRLVRMGDGSHQSGDIQIITTFRLTDGQGTRNADIVTWPESGGQRYTIIAVDDYSRFGAGFVRAIGQLATTNAT